MTSERSGIAACFAVIALMAGTHALAQGPPPANLDGTLNDYVEAGGAWHVTAEWSLHVKGASGKADFAAAFTMVRSDLWVLLTGANPQNPEARAPHTHHVSIVNGDVAMLANGFRVAGTAIITSNGSLAGFSGSSVQVDITGGTAVQYSNIKVTFAGAAAGHFGPQQLDGVVVTER